MDEGEWDINKRTISTTSITTTISHAVILFIVMMWMDIVI